jgi:hypothetical protein
MQLRIRFQALQLCNRSQAEIAMAVIDDIELLG